MLEIGQGTNSMIKAIYRKQVYVQRHICAIIPFSSTYVCMYPIMCIYIVMLPSIFTSYIIYGDDVLHK